MPTNGSELRRHLIELLDGGQAHANFDEAVRDFPVERAGERPHGLAHSAWEVLEHIRIALEDIALFSGVRGVRDGQPQGYTQLNWPDDYWPATPPPQSPEQWHQSVRAIREGMASFRNILDDPARDLFEPFPWGSGQTLLREALLIADHNAYHIGQLMLLRRLAG